jgi:hypothetical protein
MATYDVSKKAHFRYYAYYGDYSRDAFDSGYICVGSYDQDSKGDTAGIRGYLRFDLSSISGTITSATLYVNKYNSYGTERTTSVRQVTTEYDPETGLAYGTDAQNRFNAAAGTSFGNLATGNGWKSISVTSYANTHKGGFCDFGLVSSNETGNGYSRFYRSTNVPYLDITVEEATGTNIKVNVGDSWKTASAVKINIGDSWKTVSSAKINIGDTWKDIF